MDVRPPSASDEAKIFRNRLNAPFERRDGAAVEPCCSVLWFPRAPDLRRRPHKPVETFRSTLGAPTRATANGAANRPLPPCRGKDGLARLHGAILPRSVPSAQADVAVTRAQRYLSVIGRRRPNHHHDRAHPKS
jgi:hypothetical protein